MVQVWVRFVQLSVMLRSKSKNSPEYRLSAFALIEFASMLINNIERLHFLSHRLASWACYELVITGHAWDMNISKK